MSRPFGSISRRGEGKWLCRWSDVRGVRRSHMVTGTERDAELYLAAMEMDRFGADKSVTYGGYWASVVEPQIGTLQAKTRAEYARLWMRELEPHIGARLVASTNYRLVQGVIDGIGSPTVQRSTARLWSKICNMAVRDGIMPANPVQRLVFKPHDKRPKAILTAESVVSYVESALTTRYGHLVVLEMCGGLRHEEACAIRAEDIAESGGIALVNVSKARVCVDGSVVEKPPKNASSARTVPLAGICSDMLMRCDVQPRNPQTASHNWREWCGRHGVEYVPFGQMRSNFATHAGECCDGALVDVYMGHSGRSTMDAWYRGRTDAGMLMVAEAYAEYIAPCTARVPRLVVSAGRGA